MNNDLKDMLISAGKTNVASAEIFLRNELKLLQKDGELALSDDKDLTGLSLEIRVKQLFLDLGLNIIDGRSGKEDFVVISNQTEEHKDNLVIEVKSSRYQAPKLDDLRQLDDWVFDLSGEEVARKDGLGGGLNIIYGHSFGSNMVFTSGERHPTPHKGVLVFNGSVGVSFEERGSSILHSNQIEFVEKRNFCVISIDNLISLMSGGMSETWSTLHRTIGEYKSA